MANTNYNAPINYNDNINYNGVTEEVIVFHGGEPPTRNYRKPKIDLQPYIDGWAYLKRLQREDDELVILFS